MAMKKVPRFSLLAITILLWATSSHCNLQKRSSSSTTLSSMTTMLGIQACQASIEPKELIVGLNNQEYVSIKCSAKLSNGDSFSYPAMDLSLGDNIRRGIFMVRGIPEYKDNGTRCESEFLVATMALKKLLFNESLGATNPYKDEKMVNHNYNPFRFSCDVADTARNSKLPIRCSASGSIHPVKEIEYGQQCKKKLDSSKIPLEECGRNMQCVDTGTGNYKCKCKKGYIETRDVSGKVICIETVSIFQKCITNKQCTAKDPNTWCQTDAGLGYKTCQCAKNYQPIIASQTKQVLCQPYKLEQAESSSSYLNQSGTNEQSSEKVVSQYGLIIFIIVLFIVIILAIIILSLTKRKHEITQYKQSKIIPTNKKLNGNDSKTGNATEKSVVGLAYSPQNDDEDVEVKIYDIDDQSDAIRRGNLAKIIQEPPDQETNFTEQAPNFDIFAKQSVV